jgi:hypothetical protein
MKPHLAQLDYLRGAIRCAIDEADAALQVEGFRKQAHDLHMQRILHHLDELRRSYERAAEREKNVDIDQLTR